jgi:Arc/MetJ family transcription regulator
MRTSVEISDALLAKARKVMAARRVTLRSLVEEGLRRVLAERTEADHFELRDARFRGPPGFVEGRSERDVAAAIREFNDGASTL